MMRMKISPIILILVTFSMVCDLMAQPTAGFQAGINISSLSGHKDYTDSKPRYCLTGNLVIDIPLDRVGFISLETGIGISQHGMRHTRVIEDIATKTTTEVENKLDYIVMPIYLKENFSNVYTKFGVYGGYLINVKSDWKSVTEQSGQALPAEKGSNDIFVENANVYDYGLSFGFGFINHLNQGRRYRRRRGKRVIPVLQVDFKYNIGLASIDAKGDTPDMNFKNRVFMIGLTLTTVPNK